jgi:site-specific recombinase XerD
MTTETTALIPAGVAHEDAIIKIVLDGLTSENSRRAYGRALTDFLGWYVAKGRPGLSKAIVQDYKTKLQADGLAPSSINLRLSAVRKLAAEAADNGLIEQALANGIGKVKGVKQAGVRSGNWLTKGQAQRLLDLPDTSTLKGLRDRAILAVMLDCGLRRSEVANLTYGHLAQREGRWVIIDLIGKGNRVRTVPMESWAKAAIDAWTVAAYAAEGHLPLDTDRVFRSLRRGGHLDGDAMTPQAIADVMRFYSAQAGTPLAAHDGRRTFAKLARRGGAPIEQIQLSLGHASIKTTERYLGIEQDLIDAPCDYIGLRLS